MAKQQGSRRRLADELNPKEEKIVARIQRSGEAGRSIAELAKECFPPRSTPDREQARSWVRNSLRKPVRLGLIRRIDRGRYSATGEAAPSAPPAPPPRPARKTAPAAAPAVQQKRKKRSLEPGREMVRDIERMNPWWVDDPMPPTPDAPTPLARALRVHLELGKTPVLLVRGGRGEGKTIAQLQAIEALLASGVPAGHILRLQLDHLPAAGAVWEEPVLRVFDWWESSVLGTTANSVAREGDRVYLFLDELQNVDQWEVQLKHLVDHADVSVVASVSGRIARDRQRLLTGRMVTVESEAGKKKGKR